MVNIVVGDFGTGKTTYLKNNFVLKTKRDTLIYALISQDFGGLHCERNFKKYVDLAVTKSNTLFIIDEAKTAIPKQEPDVSRGDFDYKLVTWFLNARKCNNFIFIVFHSLREIPIWLISYSDMFIRFRTNDLFQHQLNRFQSFPPIVESIKEFPNMPNFTWDEITIR